MPDDAAVVGLDPGVKLVGEADGVGGEQGVDVRRGVRRRPVVVCDAQAERQPERAFYGGRRYPGQAGRTGLDVRHGPPSKVPSNPLGSWTGRPPTMVNTGPRAARTSVFAVKGSAG